MNAKYVLKGFRRSIHIESAPSVSGSSVGLGKIPLIAESIKSSSKHDLENPQFQALGTPPTIVTVAIAPSLPVYLQNGSLLSIYGTSIENINSSITWLHPIKRLIFGFHSFRYQKLESTKSATALISASSNKNKNSTLTPLTLNGSVDWALLPNDSVLAYSGSSLRISTESLPKYVRKNGWLKISNEKTGLITSPFTNGYSLISGRGDVVVKGEGSIYKIELNENEDVLIKRDNIVGISVNGDELSKCVSKFEGFQNFTNESNETISIVTEEKIDETSIKQDKNQEKFDQLKEYWIKFKQFSSYITEFFKSILPKNQDSFVNIKGPRTILLQSGIKNNVDFFQLNKSNNIEIVESILQKSTIEQSLPQDYLNYVTINNGNVTFRSTPDFKETVEKIEVNKTN